MHIIQAIFHSMSEKIKRNEMESFRNFKSAAALA